MLRTALRVIAVTLSVLHALFLFVLGSSLSANDFIFGNLGPLLVLGAFIVVGLTVLACFAPLAGGIPLMALAGLAGAIGFDLSLLAGVLFGAPSFLSGFLLIGTGREPVESH